MKLLDKEYESQIEITLILTILLPLALIKFSDNIEDIFINGSKLYIGYIFQKIVMFLLSPLILFTSFFKLRKWQFTSLVNPFKNRLKIIGTIWFFASLFILYIRYMDQINGDFKALQWCDFEYIIFPLFIGFVVFYNHGYNYMLQLCCKIGKL